METPTRTPPSGSSSPSSGTGAETAEDRRGFLSSVITLASGAVACLTPAVTGLVAFLNPLRPTQKSQGDALVRVTSLAAVPEDGTPRRFPVIADRTDAWTRSREPIGYVFLRRIGEDRVEAISVICPHNGCPIVWGEFDDEKTKKRVEKFYCGCHRASFDVTGKRLDQPSPSPRKLDTLEVDVRNETEVWVKFQEFRTGTSERIAEA